MPSTLPPSATGIGVATQNGSEQDPAAAAKPKYVISSSGHAAHPDDIIASCRALQAHIAKLQADADADLRAVEERIQARELAEKRRVAPGWLDSDARLLEPERKSATPVQSGGVGEELGGGAEVKQEYGGVKFGQERRDGVSEMAVPDEGEELDRAFGVMNLGKP